MEVLGRDAARECYRVKVGDTVARLPDAVISTRMRLTGGHGHQTAYDWIARHARDIEAAVSTLSCGNAPTPPFDTMELEATASAPQT